MNRYTIRFLLFIIPCLVLILTVSLLRAFSLTYAAGPRNKPSIEPTMIHTSSSSNCSAWSIVPSPTSLGNGSLQGVTAISVHNVWAVGYTYINNHPQTLIEHWNGKSWTVISSPNPGINNTLYAVSATSSGNVWTVGSYLGSSGINQTLIEHWDGKSWSVIPSPNPGIFSDLLYGVDALSSTDVWVVGNYNPTSSGPNKTLIEHWNGKSWTVISTPSIGLEYNYLSNVTAISAKNIWAVGTYVTNGVGLTLIEHWDGKNWSIVYDPNANSQYQAFSASAQVPNTNQIWALGTTYQHYNGHENAFVNSWDGKNWSTVPAPYPMLSNNFRALSVATTQNAWLTGDYYNNSTSSEATLIEHWDGKNWSVVASPNPGGSNSILYSVAQVPNSSQVWAVGVSSSSGPNLPLIEFYC